MTGLHIHSGLTSNPAADAIQQGGLPIADFQQAYHGSKSVGIALATGRPGSVNGSDCNHSEIVVFILQVKHKPHCVVVFGGHPSRQIHVFRVDRRVGEPVVHCLRIIAFIVIGC